MAEDPTPEWCPNCDGRECMACVFREVHDACEKSCPFCCAEPSEGTTEPLTTAADLLPSVKPSVEAVNFTEVANLAQEMLGKGVWPDTARAVFEAVLALYPGRTEGTTEPRECDRSGEWCRTHREAWPCPAGLMAGSGDVESPAPNVATSEGRDKAVATSGEQPGWEYPPPKADSVSSNDRPAPVVPDSPDVREAIWRAVAGKCISDTAAWAAVDAVLAVVGQGVTAEQAWDEGFADGKRHAFEGDDGPRFVNPYRAAVRSGEQGGE